MVGVPLRDQSVARVIASKAQMPAPCGMYLAVVGARANELRKRLARAIMVRREGSDANGHDRAPRPHAAQLIEREVEGRRAPQRSDLAPAEEAVDEANRKQLIVRRRRVVGRPPRSLR